MIGNNFEEIKVTYTEYGDDGSNMGNVEYKWKVGERAHRAIPFQGFVSPGGSRSQSRCPFRVPPRATGTYLFHRSSSRNGS